MTADANSSAAFHEEQARVAKQIYVNSLSPLEAAADWSQAKGEAEALVMSTLAASNNFTAIAAALEVSSRHLAVLRRLFAPPISQDQLELLCPSYSKTRENKGRGLGRDDARQVASLFDQWRDKSLTGWLDTQTVPTSGQKLAIVSAVTPLISDQIAATLRRNRMSVKQESEVLKLLDNMGWSRTKTSIVTQTSQLHVKQYAHKIHFATKTRPQEVDIACGLPGSVVLAMECKVTNDRTNSVKRVNDVLKKAHAWQSHWGSFVRTAAMLQGVVAFKDVKRLLDGDVEVFWSHRLHDFEAWLRTSAP